MTEPTLHFVTCADAAGGHRMAYWQWGDADATHVVLCVHGLSRQGRDFDTLAHALLERANRRVRVVCPDVVGRGHSDWLRNPQGYQLPTYAGDMLALLAQLHAEHPIGTLDYVGTSMGGLIGMAIAAARRLPAPIRRLVLNDVGPPSARLRSSASAPTSARAGAMPASRRGGRRHVGTVHQLRPAHRRAMARAVAPHAGAGRAAQRRRQRQAGICAQQRPFTLHYDPAIALPFRAITPETSAQAQAAMWELYDAINARTLLLRGAESDLLTRDTAQAMTQRGPRRAWWSSRASAMRRRSWRPRSTASSWPSSWIDEASDLTRSQQLIPPAPTSTKPRCRRHRRAFSGHGEHAGARPRLRRAPDRRRDARHRREHAGPRRCGGRHPGAHGRLRGDAGGQLPGLCVPAPEQAAGGDRQGLRRELRRAGGGDHQAGAGAEAGALGRRRRPSAGRRGHADRERAQDAARVLARPARGDAAPGLAPADAALCAAIKQPVRRRAWRASRCRCSRRWPTGWASGR